LSVISETQTVNPHLYLSVGLSLVVVGGGEEVDSTRARRDSKSMSVCVTSDRTADRRSKGVINLLFKSKVEEESNMVTALTFKNQFYA